MTVTHTILLLGLSLTVGFVGYNTYDRATSPQFVQDKKIIENKDYEKVILAGGCFWCTESEFNHMSGVISAVSGYAESAIPNPRYDQVGSGEVKAREAVEVTYDSSIIDTKTILEAYWKHSNPVDTGGQFADRGYQYTTAIYYTTEEQRIIAELQKKHINESGVFTEPVATIITPFVSFYAAEEYHQDYKDKNPIRYEVYREASGRNAYIRKTWTQDAVQKIFKRGSNQNTSTMDTTTSTSTNNPWLVFTQEDKALRLKALTPLQYNVTQKEGTEKPFANEYHNTKEKGIYVDIVSGEPLFLSQDKYDSGTGWPSFVKPITATAIRLVEDKKLFITRTEVRSVIADSHLGHVFDDGPVDRGGKRYCMNSAALRFIPLAEMVKEGYGDYVSMIK